MSHPLKYEPFGSLLKNIVDNRGKTCPTAESGVPLIATNCIDNNYLYPLYDKVRYVSDETYNTWFRDHPKSGDMVFVLKGTPGRVAWVPDPVDFCIAQDMVAIRADERKIYPKYLFAVLRSDLIQQEIEGLHVGSLIPHFKKGDFDDLKIPIVDPKLQEFIGNQYFDFSLKIDLLHRQNKTLEAMAETLFRQWFVEEADEECKEGTLGDVASFHNGKNRPDDDIGGNIPIYGGNGILGYSSKSNYDGITVIIGRVGAYCGSLYIEHNPVWISDNALVAKPINKDYSSFLFFLLKSIQLNEIAEGSSHPLLTQTLLKSLQISLPPEHLIKQFVYQTDVWLNKIHYNKNQIHTLEKLRDTLLPKLMSGEVRVEFAQGDQPDEQG